MFDPRRFKYLVVDLFGVSILESHIMFVDFGGIDVAVAEHRGEVHIARIGAGHLVGDRASGGGKEGEKEKEKEKEREGGREVVVLEKENV